MTIENLKSKIESEKLDNSLLIFKYSDTDFIAKQYISAIRSIRKCEVEFIDNIYYNNSKSDLFGELTKDTTIQVCCVDCLSNISKNIIEQNDLIVVCKKISDDVHSIVSDYVVDIPKIEPWQIKDYVYSVGEGVDTKHLDKLIELCNGDLYRLEQELKKISSFSTTERKFIFEDFLSDGIFSDLSSYDIFTFTNAIMKKDIKTACDVYSQIDNCDIEPLGLVTILLNNFRNVIKVQCNPSATPENTGIPQKQFYGIKYSCGYYTKDSLIQIFGMLTDIDRMLKSGKLPIENMIDYVVTFILSRT